MASNYPKLDLQGKGRGRKGGGRSANRSSRVGSRRAGSSGSSSGSRVVGASLDYRDRELYGPSIITSGGALRGSGGIGSNDSGSLDGGNSHFSGSLSSSSFMPARQKKKRWEHDNFLAAELRKQEQIVREQDGSLDVLSKNLSVLGDISHSVSLELDEQTMMLDELDKEVQIAEDALSKVTARAAEIVEKSGGPKWFCLIVWLLVIILFELFLLVYT